MPFRRRKKEAINDVSSELGISEDQVEKLAAKLASNEKFVETFLRKVDYKVARRVLMAMVGGGLLTASVNPALARLTLSDQYIELDGQKFYPAAKGGYSAIVYIDGDLVSAEDPNGKIRAQGAAGVDDNEVIQSVLDVGGRVFIRSGTYNATVKITKSNTVLYGEGVGTILKGLTFDNNITNVAIKELKIVGNGTGEGIKAYLVDGLFENKTSCSGDIADSSNNTITNTTVALNSNRGITLANSSNNQIINNFIDSNGNIGVHLWLRSTNNTVNKNTIIENILYGLRVAFYSNDNNIEENTICSSSGGDLYIFTDSSGNTGGNICDTSNISAGNTVSCLTPCP